MHDVFISYASEDAAVANATCAALEAYRVRCWIAPRDLLAGIEYGESIIYAIQNCNAVVLVFSAQANASPHVRREVERAVSNGKIIVPFRIENVAPTKAMEYCLGNTHWLDALTPPLEAHLATLVSTVNALLAVPQADRGTNAPVPPPENGRPVFRPIHSTTPTEVAMRTCPACAEPINAAEQVCRSCGIDLTVRRDASHHGETTPDDGTLEQLLSRYWWRRLFATVCLAAAAAFFLNGVGMSVSPKRVEYTGGAVLAFFTGLASLGACAVLFFSANSVGKAFLRERDNLIKDGRLRSRMKSIQAQYTRRAGCGSALAALGGFATIICLAMYFSPPSPGTSQVNQRAAAIGVAGIVGVAPLIVGIGVLMVARSVSERRSR